jgi:FixJ family two-component response regulator
MASQPLIAIVDDDEAVRDSLSALLLSTGFAISSHASGEAFLAHEETYLADCVILDVELPGHSGLDLLSDLRAAEWDVPVILLTGLSLPSVQDRARHLGGATVLGKPPTEAVLVEALRNCLAPDPFTLNQREG